MIKRNFQKLYKISKDPWLSGDCSDERYKRILKLIECYKPFKINSILDLGCGNGGFTNQLGRFGANVIGIDIAKEAIEYAKKEYPQIQFIRGDISRLETIRLPFSSFQLITILDVLYYFPINIIKQILHNVWSLLSDEGILILRHWAPGGAYLTPPEWRILLNPFFKILYSEELTTKHAIFVCQKKYFQLCLTYDYETWQPLPKGKSINWEKDIFDATAYLLELAERYHIKLNFFVEMGEYYWCKQNLPKIAKKMEEQWKEIIQRGHDVQIHLHPAWLPDCGANYDSSAGKWFWDDNYQRIHALPKETIKEIIAKCKKDLEAILKPVKNDYEAIIYRAGKYQIQPNKEIFEIFKEIGIKADSSVWKGGYNEEHSFDFRRAYSNYQPYFASNYNINYLAPSGEAEILELPIASDGKNKFSLDNFSYRKALKFLRKILRKPKRLYLRYKLARFPPSPFSYNLLNKIYNFYLRILDKIEAVLVGLSYKLSDEQEEVVVALGHTKLINNRTLLELEKFFKYLSLKKEYKTAIISAVAKEIINNKKEVNHLEYLVKQTQGDKAAILRENRNWQQSLYAQEKIPLDRKKILDLGCGTGYGTKRINDNIGETIGIDISEEFLKKAKENYPEIKFLKMDFHNLEFPDEYFDCVYADNVLEHSPFPQQVFKEIFRVLKDKGLLVALIPPDARNPKYSGEDHFWKTDKDDIEARLTEVGFSNIKIENVNVIKKFCIVPDLASNNSMLIVTAWKWKNGFDSFERCLQIMDFVYRTLNPEKPHSSNNPRIILKEKYAWCKGYILVFGYLLKKEGFSCHGVTLYAKNHPKGRGVKKIDTHEVAEVLINNKWFVFDPTTNKYFTCRVQDLLKTPHLADEVIQNQEKDERYYKRQYHLYTSSYFYQLVYKIKKYPL